MAIPKNKEYVPPVQRFQLVVNYKIQCKRDVLSCRYSPNHDIILAGHTDGVIRLYDTEKGELIRALEREDMEEGCPVTSIWFKPSSMKNVEATENAQAPETPTTTLISTYTDGRVVQWNYATGAIVRTIVEKRQVLGSAWHPSLNKFISFGDDSKIMLYDEETGKRELTYERGMSDNVDGHSSRIFAAVFHPVNHNEFVSGGWDNTLQYWDIRQQHSVRHYRGCHISGDGIDIRKDGREMLTSSYQRDGPIQVWQYQTGKLLTTIDPDNEKCMLYCGQYLSNEFAVVGGTDPNLLRIVNLRGHRTVSQYKGSTYGVYCCDNHLKTFKIKKVPYKQYKIAFSIDRMLVQCEFTV